MTEQEHIGSVAMGDSNAEALEALTNLLVSELGDTYSCTRVWSAWGYGTMTQDDFEPAEERAGEIADSILRAIPALTAALSRPAQEPVAAKPLYWSGSEARSSLGDLYSVLQLSPNVWTTYMNGTAFPGWKAQRSSAMAIAQDNDERRQRAAPQLINPTHSQVAGTPGLLTDPAPSDRLETAVDLRKRVMRAIFDPGATEGFKGDRDLTTWQTDAVMRALKSEGSADE